jgi:hypothetical protein
MTNSAGCKLIVNAVCRSTNQYTTCGDDRTTRNAFCLKLDLQLHNKGVQVLPRGFWRAQAGQS